jgi:RNA recognition motif-containing protein
VDSTRLYIGNLSYDASESDIEELFKGVGPVRSVEIVYNKHTHKSKGYGFVEMLRIDEAKRAVEVLHDQHFMGRQLIVSGAKAKNAEEGEAAVTAREQKENASQHPETGTPTASTTPETVVSTSEETASEVASAPAAIIEEVHSLEAESQKETFV